MELEGKVIEWRSNPYIFVREVIGVHPTNQQEDGLRELGKLYEGKMALGYSHGGDLTDEQKEYSSKLGISIRSGHGTGKDTFLSWVYLWLLTCFPGSRGLVTAPTGHQLEDILWPEIRKWNRKSSGKLHQIIDVKAEKAQRKVGKQEDEAFVVHRTAKVTGGVDEQAETLSGFHADYLILSVDEASGVEDGVFKPMEGAQTGLFNIGIIIGNPTKSRGYFYSTHHADRSRWVTLHWSCEESNIDAITGTTAMQSYIDRMRDKYGRDSNFYRIRVQGEFPLAEPDALIPLELILAAVGRDVVEDANQGLVLGVDVARMGDDPTIICPRRGMIVEPLLSYHKLDTMETVGFIMMWMADMHPRATLIDSIGIGAGVVDRLRELRKSVHGVNVAEVASRRDRFFRLRDDLYWRVRERFESRRIQIPNDDELIGELSSIKFRVESNGKIKVEGKNEMRKRGLSSPNRADALMLTEYFPDSAFRTTVPDRYDMFQERPKSRGWMGV